ncbi:MAG: hypothetical protein ABEJ25_06485 [Candidatus Bipolaricaulia bacterium]
MEKLVEGLELVEEVNGLIKNLQESLELFEQGNYESAFKKINSAKEGIEGLEIEDLPDQDEVEERLGVALENLEWISEHPDRAKGRDVDLK